MQLIANGSPVRSTPATPQAPVGTPGYPINTPPGPGVTPTILDPDVVTAILAELVNVIAASSQAPTAGTFTQVRAAIPYLAGRIAGQERRLKGSAAGGTKTASWTADELITEVALGGLSFKGLSLSLSFDGTTTGANGMDVGSMPVSGDLSIYAIYNPNTDTWSTLGTAGTTSSGTIYSGTHMPGGYTGSALLATFVTDGSGNIPASLQIGREIYVNISLGTGLTASSATSFSLAAAVPANAAWWTPHGDETTTGASNLYVGPTSALGVGTCALWGTNSVSVTGGRVPIVTSQTAYYAISVGATWSIRARSYGF